MKPVNLDQEVFRSMAKAAGLDEEDAHLQELYRYVESLFPDFKVAEGLQLGETEPMSIPMLSEE